MESVMGLRTSTLFSFPSHDVCNKPRLLISVWAKRLRDPSVPSCPSGTIHQSLKFPPENLNKRVSARCRDRLGHSSADLGACRTTASGSYCSGPPLSAYGSISAPMVPVREPGIDSCLTEVFWRHSITWCLSFLSSIPASCFQMSLHVFIPTIQTHETMWPLDS